MGVKGAISSQVTKEELEALIPRCREGLLKCLSVVSCMFELTWKNHEQCGRGQVRSENSIASYQ